MIYTLNDDSIKAPDGATITTLRGAASELNYFHSLVTELKCELSGLRAVIAIQAQTSKELKRQNELLKDALRQSSK